MVHLRLKNQVILHLINNLEFFLSSHRFLVWSSLLLVVVLIRTWLMNLLIPDCFLWFLIFFYNGLMILKLFHIRLHLLDICLAQFCLTIFKVGFMHYYNFCIPVSMI